MTAPEIRAMSSEERRSLHIVAAAIQHNGETYSGKRHSEVMSEIREKRGFVHIPQEAKGFVTNTGHFVSRFQAGAIAFIAGQTKDRHTELLSEHLW